MHNLTAIEIADVLGCAVADLQALQKDYGAPELFIIEGWIQWFVQHCNKQHEKAIAEAKVEKPQDNLARVNAEIKNIELQKRKGILIDRTECAMAWYDAMKILESNLTGLERRLASAYAAKRTEIEIEFRNMREKLTCRQIEE